MDAALAGLIGVGVGGLVSLMTEERRTRAGRRQLKEHAARELQQALRLVEEEWATAVFAAETTLEDGGWWDQSYYQVSTSQWERFQTIIAGSDIDEDRWDEMTLAASETAAMLHRRVNRTDLPTRDDYRFVQGSGKAAWDGIRAIREYRGKHPWVPWQPSQWWTDENLGDPPTRPPEWDAPEGE